MLKNPNIKGALTERALTPEEVKQFNEASYFIDSGGSYGQTRRHRADLRRMASMGLFSVKLVRYGSGAMNWFIPTGKKHPQLEIADTWEQRWQRQVSADGPCASTEP